MSTSAPGPVAPTAGVKASLGRRVGAYVIDMVPFALIGSVVGIVTMVISLSAIASQQQLTAAVPKVTIVQIVAYVLTFAWWLVVTIMQGGTGSVGQRMCGISLQQEGTGRPIGFWRAALRNIVFAASCVILVGYFTPLFDAERHRG
ncbi:MAG TPA: RDD family protein, partial [Microbacterium sp.]|uniref:RDD family protein n=1 Tax=Microbacterium sp. TaxID=51671 RepID=UPI002B46CF66